MVSGIWGYMCVDGRMVRWFSLSQVAGGRCGLRLLGVRAMFLKNQIRLSLCLALIDGSLMSVFLSRSMSYWREGQVWLCPAYSQCSTGDSCVSSQERAEGLPGTGPAFGRYVLSRQVSGKRAPGTRSLLKSEWAGPETKGIDLGPCVRLMGFTSSLPLHLLSFCH